jgi:arylsulfatase A-like enzyme
MPNAQRFDQFFGTPMHNGYTKEVDPKRFIVDLMRNGEVIESPTDVNLLTEKYTEEAVNFIRQHRAHPFLLLLARNMPHVSLGVSDDFKGKSARGLYGDVIEELDWSLGEIVKELKQLDLEQETLVIFLSENGPPLGELTDQNGGSAQPLRGGKYSNWEGGVRVPAIMQWPGKIPEGQTDLQVASLLDLFPTIANIASVPVPGGIKLDGQNLLARITKKDASQQRPPLLLLFSHHAPGREERRPDGFCPAKTNFSAPLLPIA